jgi:hypothetical protein
MRDEKPAQDFPMKIPTFTLILACAPVAIHTQQAKPAFRDAATNEQLTEKYRKVSLENPMKHLPPAQGADPSVENRVGNLLENSDILSFNGLTTLVPKSALVLVPEKFKATVNNHQAGSKIVSWLDFYSVNRGWISTVEVTFAQARGEEPVSPETLATLGESGNMIVAVLKGGPISVLPPKKEAPAEPASQDKQP